MNPPPYALHPLYTDENVFADSTILGMWIDDESSEESILLVEKTGEFSFRYTWSAEAEGAITGTGYTLNLGTRKFFDIFPGMSELEGDTLPYPILPAHLFFRYELREDTLVFGFIPDKDWEVHLSSKNESFIWQNAGSDPDGISDRDNHLILLQNTHDLQALVMEVWDAWASEEEEGYFVRRR